MHRHYGMPFVIKSKAYNVTSQYKRMCERENKSLRGDCSEHRYPCVQGAPGLAITVTVHTYSELATLAV